MAEKSKCTFYDRQKFEQWYLKHFSYDLKGKYRQRLNDYTDVDAAHAWTTWQAATLEARPVWTHVSQGLPSPETGPIITMDVNAAFDGKNFIYPEITHWAEQGSFIMPELQNFWDSGYEDGSVGIFNPPSDSGLEKDVYADGWQVAIDESSKND